MRERTHAVNCSKLWAQLLPDDACAQLSRQGWLRPTAAELFFSPSNSLRLPFLGGLPIRNSTRCCVAFIVCVCCSCCCRCCWLTKTRERLWQKVSGRESACTLWERSFVAAVAVAVVLLRQFYFPKFNWEILRCFLPVQRKTCASAVTVKRKAVKRLTVNKKQNTQPKQQARGLKAAYCISV